MKQSVKDWLLSRDEDATQRLDAIRRAAVSPERAGFSESVIEIFRPNLRLWISMAALWLLLVGIRLSWITNADAPSRVTEGQLEMASARVPYDETISNLDGRS